uniref:Uncharacterized protein n=1 Tax=Arundo donax TaxID=35708 RepID=A0A0A9GSL8_ARUDO
MLLLSLLQLFALVMEA